MIRISTHSIQIIDYKKMAGFHIQDTCSIYIQLPPATNEKIMLSGNVLPIKPADLEMFCLSRPHLTGVSWVLVTPLPLTKFKTLSDF